MWDILREEATFRLSLMERPMLAAEVFITLAAQMVMIFMNLFHKKLNLFNLLKRIVFLSTFILFGIISLTCDKNEQ